MRGPVLRISGLCDRVTPVGSRVTCRPAPTDTDEDYLILATKHHGILIEVLNDDGWVMGGSLGLAAEGASLFQSYTLGDLNLIVTDDEEFHHRFLVATSLAKRLNILDKQDRIALFQAVLYANEHNVHSLEMPA